MGKLKDRIEARALEVLKESISVDKFNAVGKSLGLDVGDGLSKEDITEFLTTPEGKVALIHEMHSARLLALIEILDAKETDEQVP